MIMIYKTSVFKRMISSRKVSILHIETVWSDIYLNQWNTRLCFIALNMNLIILCMILKTYLISGYEVLCSLSPSGACEHRQRDVFRAPRSWRLRCLLQPPGRPRPLLHHRLQLLRGDACRDISCHSEGHLVWSTGATAAYCVELLLPPLRQEKKICSLFSHSSIL